MKSLSVTVLSAAITLAGTCSCSAPARRRIMVPSEARSPEARALWVWDTGFIGKDSGTSTFFTFVTAKHIGRVFLSVPLQSFPSNETPLRRFLAFAHEKGIKVEALNGDPSWVLPHHQAKCLEFIEAIARFNAGRAAGERFDAVHLDVEPQGLPEWANGGTGRAASEFLALLKKAHRLTRRERIPLAVDIPFEFNHIQKGHKSLTERTVRLANEVALMAYRAHADQVIRSSEPAVTAGDKLGTAIYVGISARSGHQTGNRPGITPESSFEALAANVVSAFRGHPSFEGVAIEDYRLYLTLASSR